MTRPIVVIDDSNLAVARLLGPLVQRLEGRGSLLTGDQLATAIGSRSPDVREVVYGLVQADGKSNERHLQISEDVPIRRKLQDRAFPRGKYA